MAASPPVKAWLERDGALLRVRLDRPKANLIDGEMIAGLQAAFAEHRTRGTLRGVLLDASGPHFSFGASVEEHLPDRCARMLASLHALILAMLDYPAPILVAVHGQCLGGGLELALAGSLIFGSGDAHLGQPEVKLGVFAPAASCLLRYRVNQSTAEDLLLSGRSMTSEEAHACGLLHTVATDPVAAALAYFNAHLFTKSAASLRMAIIAARAPMIDHVKRRLGDVERLYLDRLMSTHDAREGLAAFMEKREPVWEHR